MPISKFLSFTEEIDYAYYVTILKAVRPSNVIGDLTNEPAKPLLEHPYKDIIALEAMYKAVQQHPEKMIEIVAVYLQIETEKLESCGVFDFYAVFNQVTNEFTSLLTREKNYLSSDPEAEELEAGIESLSKFGRLATVDALSGGDLLKHNDIIELPYSRVFTKLYLEAEKAKYQRELYRIKARKTE